MELKISAERVGETKIKTMENLSITKCILCNDEFTGWGHNPYPLAPAHFKCCSVCNQTEVIPYRIYKLQQSK